MVGSASCHSRGYRIPSRQGRRNGIAEVDHEVSGNIHRHLPDRDGGADAHLQPDHARRQPGCSGDPARGRAVVPLQEPPPALPRQPAARGHRQHGAGARVLGPAAALRRPPHHLPHQLVGGEADAAQLQHRRHRRHQEAGALRQGGCVGAVPALPLPPPHACARPRAGAAAGGCGTAHPARAAAGPRHALGGPSAARAARAVAAGAAGWRHLRQRLPPRPCPDRGAVPRRARQAHGLRRAGRARGRGAALAAQGGQGGGGAAAAGAGRPRRLAGCAGGLRAAGAGLPHGGAAPHRPHRRQVPAAQGRARGRAARRGSAAYAGAVQGGPAAGAGPRRGRVACARRADGSRRPRRGARAAVCRGSGHGTGGRGGRRGVLTRHAHEAEADCRCSAPRGGSDDANCDGRVLRTLGEGKANLRVGTRYAQTKSEAEAAPATRPSSIQAGPSHSRCVASQDDAPRTRCSGLRADSMF
mmetsp:Transcript_608/g.1365  ORF Transcript_608/g.1365 Transcript_608/m.1365 type:complete len:471 (+) Transcript_608:463-1875(+)